MMKIRTHISILLALLVVSVITSCSEELDLESQSFIKIYDNQDGDVTYDPIDIIETTDGYLVLSATSLNNTDFAGIQILSLTTTGDFQTEFTMPEELVLPTGDIFSANERFYFFGMNRTTLRVVLISTDAAFTDVQTTTLGSLAYPLSAASTSGGNLLVQSYDIEDGLTVISEVQTDGTVVNSSGYSIGVGQDVEQNILAHYLDPTVDLPFFCGELSGGTYYFNGFYNFSMSMVFTDFGASPLGVVQGQADDGGIRDAQVLTGSGFALVGYQFEENYLVPSTTLSTSSITSSIDLFTSEQAELRTQTPGVIEQVDDTHVAMAVETESREVVIYFYNTTSAELTGIETIGFLNPFTLGNMSMDAEGNLLIVGTTFVSGRFERVFFRKLQSTDLQGFIGS